MRVTEPWVGHAAIGLTAVGIAGVAVMMGVDSDSPLRRRLAAHVAALSADLAFVRSRWRGERVATLQIVISAALLATVFVLGTLWIAPAVVPVFVAPTLLLGRARATRIGRIDEQLDTWLIALSNALKSGTSLGEAIASSAKLMRAPIREELEHALTQYHLGSPLDQALSDMAERLSSRAVTGAVVTLRIARNTGGDLSRTLEEAAASLREMARLEGVVRTKTAEGKAQAVVVSSIPAPLFAALEWMSPGFLSPLFDTMKGRLVILAAACLWIAAIALAVKITRVEV